MSVDQLIVEFDRGLRTLLGVHVARRASPAETVDDAPLDEASRLEAARLMRVNHSGEVCAQALYQGQALASANPELVEALQQAAKEEEDHLAWSAQRIRELGGRTSLLNPVWYAGSLAIGYTAGRFGDAWNLGFLKETERQVEAHLDSHLGRLAEADERTRVVIAAMRDDERGHAETASQLGASNLPLPIRAAMRMTAKVMTSLAYRV